jgi:16S rRNA (cytosine967-C5)-methyltransferase
MILSARLSAAIHILGDIATKRRPAADCLRDWGQGHRFAGSGDRSAIASLVYDALRVQSSSAWMMGSDTPRAILLGALKRMRGMDIEAIASRSRKPT